MHCSARRSVYRALRTVDKQRRILIALEPAYATPSRVQAFERKYQLTKSLANVPGVVQALSLHEFGAGARYIEFDDTDSESVRSWLARCSPSLEDRLDVAIKTLTPLQSIHERNVIHKVRGGL